MPGLTDKRQVSSATEQKTQLPVFSSLQNPSQKGKKKKKGRKLKFRRQFASMTSIISLENEEENNVSKQKSAVCNTEKSVCKLPSLPKSPTSASGSFVNTCTPRAVSQQQRNPPTLPANIQPGAHERRKKMPLLSAIKPENEKSEKDRFLRANFNYNPFFIYRFPAEPETLERHSKPSDRFLMQAILIMENAIQKYGSYEVFEEQTGGKILQRSSIVTMIQRYLKREDLEREIMVNLSEELLSRGSMTRVKGKATLNVRVVNLREYWVEGLLRHEIGTHYLRSMNNRFHDWYNFKVRKEMGLQPYNPTEEGLASLHSVLCRKDPCLWRAALLYYTAYKAAFLSLKELFRDLGQFVSDPLVRWDYCIRAKRGQVDTSCPGGFCKDQVYLDGALQILKHRKKIDFHMLIRLGKISFEDIEKLRHQVDLDNTQIPFFMEDLDYYHKCLDRIVDANGLTDEMLQEL